MLLEYGNTIAIPTWQLDEKLPTGYSRVYYVNEADIMYGDSLGTRALKADTLYALPSSIPYRAWRLSDRDFRCTYLHIDFFPHAVSGLIEIPVRPGSALECLLLCAVRAIDEQNHDLVASLAAVFGTVLEKSEHFIRPSGRMAAALMYIASHLSDKISIGTLSEITAYHPHYFIKLFKEDMGMSPHQYILRMRMQEAARILRAGGTVGDAAANVGYGDASSFARAFKACYGTQPARFAQVASPIP